ncbi:flagellar hook-length control protein FliK [Rhodovulum strictum]|uniref:flagellar hook-length control protein FliK n=1 Tax=Rhodovulum strictum TaxID=58314 RepID=UPI0014780FD4|nr:flagellar hook-length control protein FliK [Rhodovulum strictum]
MRPALAAEGDLVLNRRDARSIRAAQPADLPPPAGPGVRAEATATPVAATPPAQDGAATDPTRAIASSGEPGISETTARGDAPVSDRPLTDAPRSAAPAPQLAEAPRPAMRTMAEALHRSADGAVELTLSPEELGRVRLTLAPGEHGITVTINAERGDTLELMRRHADLLGNAMRELGYGEVVLDFRGKGARQGPAPGSLAIAGTEGEDGAPIAALDGAPSRRVAASGGLDLRL